MSSYFPTDLESILKRIDQINPKKYKETRNFENGSLSYLSPYISRGVISTKFVYQRLISNGYHLDGAEKYIQELAWRDFFQQVWQFQDIFSDVKNVQEGVKYHGIPKQVVDANTGIKAMDKAILELYQTGYMHNHMRMYVASLCCNVFGCHWKAPAQWMYYHLLDGDLASNHLSWQWVSGAFSNKKYWVSQKNINLHFELKQSESILTQNSFENLQTEIIAPPTTTSLPSKQNPALKDCPTLVYNLYNLDPFWHDQEEFQRILLIEPTKLRAYPIKEKTLEFILSLSKNIEGLQVLFGEFSVLANQIQKDNLYFKEHPLNSNYSGNCEQRQWLSPTKTYYPSFFKYWKQIKAEL